MKKRNYSGGKTEITKEKLKRRTSRVRFQTHRLFRMESSTRGLQGRNGKTKAPHNLKKKKDNPTIQS